MGKFHYVDEVNNIEKEIEVNKENRFVFIENKNNEKENSFINLEDENISFKEDNFNNIEDENFSRKDIIFDEDEDEEISSLEENFDEKENFSRNNSIFKEEDEEDSNREENTNEEDIFSRKDIIFDADEDEEISSIEENIDEEDSFSRNNSVYDEDDDDDEISSLEENTDEEDSFSRNNSVYDENDEEISSLEENIDEEDSFSRNNSVYDENDKEISSLEENIDIENDDVSSKDDYVNQLDGIDLSKLVKEEKNQKNNKKSDKFKGVKKEVSYKKRVILSLLLLIIFVILFSFFVNKAFIYNSEKRIKYYENGNIDYKVNLLENDFYDKPYLDKNMMYVANLIKNINIDFKYIFDIEEKTSMDFVYEVIGELVIASEEQDDVIGSKSYSLVKKKDFTMKNKTRQEIEEKIVIDYNYYNEIANKFKMDYGIDSNSYLKVYLKVYKKNYSEISSYKIDETKDLGITIPLSQKAINIKLDTEKLNGEFEVISRNSSISDVSILYIVLSIIFLIFVIIAFVKLLKLLMLLIDNNSKYDKYIKKILTEYDRLIVETSNLPDFGKNEIIKISKFTELLDVRDNLKLPIMYCVVTEHHKSYFYIKKDNEIYLLTIKEVDLI